MTRPLIESWMREHLAAHWSPDGVDIGALVAAWADAHGTTAPWDAEGHRAAHPAWKAAGAVSMEDEERTRGRRAFVSCAPEVHRHFAEDDARWNASTYPIGRQTDGTRDGPMLENCSRCGATVVRTSLLRMAA